MLAEGGVDAIYIASPNALHAEHAARVLNAGKHVFIEKCATDQANTAGKLCRLAAARDLVVAECFMYRFHAQFDLVMKVLNDSEHYGPFDSFSFEMGVPGFDSDNIRYRPDLGGGALRDVGVYCLSGARAVLGEGIRCRDSHLAKSPGRSVDENGYGLYEDEQDRIAWLEWAFGRAYRNRFRAWGEQYAIEVDHFFSKSASKQTIINLIHSDPSRCDEIAIPAENHFASMLDRFSEAMYDNALGERLARELIEQARLVEDITGSGLYG
jgi:predicted dehydrogenase